MSQIGEYIKAKVEYESWFNIRFRIEMSGDETPHHISQSLSTSREKLMVFERLGIDEEVQS